MIETTYSQNRGTEARQVVIQRFSQIKSYFLVDVATSIKSNLFVIIRAVIMEKGEGGNRKYRQKRRGKRANTFSGVRRQEKSAKLDDGDENMAAVIENINDFPPAGSTDASSVTSTEIDIDICPSSVTPDDEKEWVDIEDEIIETVSKIQ